LIEQVLAQASFDLDPRLISNSVETMTAFALMNRGVCFQFREPGKAPIPSGDMIALPLGLCCRPAYSWRRGAGACCLSRPRLSSRRSRSRWRNDADERRAGRLEV